MYFYPFDMYPAGTADIEATLDGGVTAGNGIEIGIQSSNQINIYRQSG